MEAEGSEDRDRLPNSLFHRDRLSELPNSLILLILSFLPMVDVVRTSVLSKQWKDLWTTIPVLDFSEQKIVFDLWTTIPALDFSKPKIVSDDLHSNNCSNVFVDRVLERWKGIKITEFHVDLNCNVDLNCSCFTATQTDSWLNFALDHGVEELSVYHDYLSKSVYRAPLRLFSYSTIRKLRLWYCDLTDAAAESVHWNRLKNLEISVLQLDDDHFIDKILSGAPQLEVLKLSVTGRYGNLNIHSCSLRQLRIAYLDRSSNWLRIWAPNLQTFEISGSPCRRYQVMNLSSVKELSFDLHSYEDFDLHSYGVLGVLEEMLRQFFPSILRAEKVTLSKQCMEALPALRKKYLLSLASRFKFVRLRSFKKIADLGKIFRELESMAIQYRRSEQQVQVTSEEVEYRSEIWCYSGDEKLMFLLMESLLGHASLLVQMEVSANRTSKCFPE